MATGQIDLIKTIIQSISLLVVVYKIQYFAVVYSLLVGVVYYFLRRKIGKIEFLYRTNISPLKRKKNYLGRVMYVKDSMADIKTTDISNVLLSRHSDIGENIISTSKKMLEKGTFFYTIGGILLSSIYPVVLGIVTYFIMDEKDLSAFASITIAATLLSILYIALNTAFALAEVYLVKYIISFTINGALFKEILNVLLIYLIIMIISVVYKNIYDNYIVRIYNEIFINRMQNFLYSKVKNIDYADFDNSEFYDSYSRALRDGVSRGITVYNNFVNLVSGFLILSLWAHLLLLVTSG